MRKLTDFIVEKRNIILILFVILTGVSFYLSKNVKVNYDIANYLPASSETRKGLDKMDEEFQELKTSTLNIMLENLTKKEKEKAFQYLTKINHVSSVEYEDTKEYNQGKNTLYILTIDAKEDSKVAKEVYQEINKHFKNQLVDTSGSVSTYNKDVLPFFIIALAVGSAFIILLIMSSSYIEPVLFLTTILIAVVLNSGTNIIFANVSNITKSISAILQMALSMDYSIMLMNRYRQEKEKEQDKVKAMKNALHNAFQSISSSSITTIVGLLALVFMSFTIGADLGFVLAKGVLLSLLSIFTCLPGLILLSDKLITKTKKKSLEIKINILGKAAYHFRYIALVFFLMTCIGSYFLKGNLGIAYTTEGTDKIDEVFTLNNQMALLYPKSAEKIVANYCKSLEKKTKIDEVLCYGNTINLPLASSNLKNKLEELGSDVDIEDYLIRIIYYYYYHQDEKNKMTLEELINFIENEVYQNKKMNSSIDEEIKQNITRLKKLVGKEESLLPRTKEEIHQVLNVDEAKVNDLLLYYQSKKVTTKMTLNQFANFMEKRVLPDEKYSNNIDTNTKNNLELMQKFTQKENILTNKSKEEVGSLLGLNEKTTESLYAYYLQNSEITETLTLNEFANFVLTEVMNSDNQNRESIQKLALFSDKEQIEKNRSSSEIASLFGLDQEQVANIFHLVSINKKMTIKDFVTSVIFLKENNYITEDVSAIISLSQNEELMNKKESYNAKELATMLNTNEETINSLYVLIDMVKGTDQLSAYNFVSEIINNNQLMQTLDPTIQQSLQNLNIIMTSSLNQKSYRYQEISLITGMPDESTKGIYSLYFAKNTNLSLYQVTNFILQHQNDEALKNSLGKDQIASLMFLKNIMDSTIQETTYSKEDLATFLKMDEESIALLYSLYEQEQGSEIKVSFKDFVGFLVEDVMEEETYKDSFPEETKQKLITVNNLMKNSQQEKKYTKEEIYHELSQLTDNLEKNLIDLTYLYYGSVKEFDENSTMTIETFVRFLNETILTDDRFVEYIDKDQKEKIIDAKKTIKEAKEQLVGSKFSRIILNTKYEPESKETFAFIQKIKDDLGSKIKNLYIIGDSPMAYEMSQTFQNELNLITILTMLFIFIVVAVTFKSLLIPIILVLLIQCAVYLTMWILSLTGTVYFISILIVQSILMGATIDYAILYTSYYLEARKQNDKKQSLIISYNNSLHTILTSASILVIVTLIVGNFASAVAAKICITLSQGCLCSALLIIFLLPAVLGACDKMIVKNK